MNTIDQVVACLRDTPVKSVEDAKDALTEVQALGAISVRPEVLAVALLYHAKNDNCSPLNELVMMEDYNHAFVGNNLYWIVPAYLQPQA